MLKTVEVTQTRIYCQRPWGQRITMGVVGLVVGGLCLYLLHDFWPAPGSLTGRAPVEIWELLAQTLMIPMLGLVFPTALFLYYAGPADLTVDTDRRTYRFRRGFPLLASWREGPMDDIAGLRMSAISRRSDSASAFQLLIDWKFTSATPWTLGNGPLATRRPFQLGTSRDEGSLRLEADRLAQKLGVPLREAEPLLEDNRKRGLSRLMVVPLIVFFLSLGVPSVLTGRELARQGQDTSGVVTGLRNSKHLIVRYTYQIGGQDYQGRASVNGSAFDSLDIGSPVTVRYLPAYPHTSTVEGSQDAGQGLTMLLPELLLVVVALGAGFARRNKR